MGYHLKKIPKGELGQASKITEEYLEFIDALEQGNTVMELLELSDLLGAIESYTRAQANISLEELIKMTRATQSAFKDGERK
jgi:NTP pyrophosphatase (non-canonical NTP hydrolase)